MITRANGKALRDFQTKFLKTQKLSYADSRKIFHRLYKEHLAIGKKPQSPLEGIESRIRIAKAINNPR